MLNSSMQLWRRHQRDVSDQAHPGTLLDRNLIGEVLEALENRPCQEPNSRFSVV